MVFKTFPVRSIEFNSQKNCLVDGFKTFPVKSIEFTVRQNSSQVPLILGIWGGKGQGKSFQCELVFAKMGIK